MSVPSQFSVAIVGEGWEAAFAAGTAATLARWAPPDTVIWTSEEYVQAFSSLPNAVRFVAPRSGGFQSYGEIRLRILSAIPGTRILVLAAGVLPEGPQPLESLGASYGTPRHVEWISPDTGPTVMYFSRPAHRPPAQPIHRTRQEGLLTLWEVDGGDRYYLGLRAQNRFNLPAVFRNYGPARPIFTYNTNSFDEPLTGRHEQYVILASGLLGLRLILESDPSENSKAIVYDINPWQLAWIRYLLAHAAQSNNIDTMIEQFTTAHPGVDVRPLQAHERDNATEQREWYRLNHKRLPLVAEKLRWEFVQCDLLTAPDVLLDKLEPDRTTMFMYLDIFLIWNVETDHPWVEHHLGIARSLEACIRETIRKHVSFVPGPESRRFQLSRNSPFLKRRA